MTALPKPQAKASDHGAGHEENHDEARNVVPERHVGAADRARGKKMPEEANDGQNHPEPDPGAVKSSLFHHGFFFGGEISSRTALSFSLNRCDSPSRSTSSAMASTDCWRYSMR